MKDKYGRNRDRSKKPEKKVSVLCIWLVLHGKKGRELKYCAYAHNYIKYMDVVCGPECKYYRKVPE